MPKEIFTIGSVPRTSFVPGSVFYISHSMIDEEKLLARLFFRFSDQIFKFRQSMMVSVFYILQSNLEQICGPLVSGAALHLTMRVLILGRNR